MKGFLCKRKDDISVNGLFENKFENKYKSRQWRISEINAKLLVLYMLCADRKSYEATGLSFFFNLTN